MKTKNFNKKIIAYFLTSLFFVFCSFGLACAYTESECTSHGGSCQIDACGSSSNTVGTCWESGNTSFKKTNCCGSASAATVGIGTTTASTAENTSSSSFGNPISSTTIEGVLSSVMSYLKGIAGTIAVIFIIIGGVMYMLSAGDKDMAERAKKTLVYAMAGLAIVVAAPTFYSEIVSVLGGSSSLSGTSGTSLKTIASNVLTLLLSIAGFLAIIMMIIGAVQMLSAMGEEERYEQGKKTVIYSIVGIAIVAASLVIATQIKSLIGG